MSFFNPKQYSPLASQMGQGIMQQGIQGMSQARSPIMSLVAALQQGLGGFTMGGQQKAMKAQEEAESQGLAEALQAGRDLPMNMPQRQTMMMPSMSGGAPMDLGVDVMVGEKESPYDYKQRQKNVSIDKMLSSKSKGVRARGIELATAEAMKDYESPYQTISTGRGGIALVNRNNPKELTWLNPMEEDTITLGKGMKLMDKEGKVLAENKEERDVDVRYIPETKFVNGVSHKATKKIVTDSKTGEIVSEEYVSGFGPNVGQTIEGKYDPTTATMTRGQEVQTNAARRIARVDELIENAPLNALQTGTQVTSAIAGVMGKGPEWIQGITPDQWKSNREDVTNLRTRTLQVFNEYVKEVTGAALPVDEYPRYKGVIPTDEDDKISFMIKANTLRDLLYQDIIQQEMLMARGMTRREAQEHWKASGVLDIPYGIEDEQNAQETGGPQKGF